METISLMDEIMIRFSDIPLWLPRVRNRQEMLLFFHYLIESGFTDRQTKNNGRVMPCPAFEGKNHGIARDDKR
jgi:hypothetical protein